MPNLFGEDLGIALHQAFADNLDQICPKHSTRDIVPVHEQKF